MNRITTQCPFCKRTFYVQSEWLGHQTGCPACGRHFIIQENPPTASANTSANGRTTASNKKAETKHQNNLVWFVVGGIALLLLFVFMNVAPALGAARDKAREISCISNLKQLQLEVFVFAEEHNDKLPNTLDDLCKDENYRKLITCPEGQPYQYMVNPYTKLSDLGDEDPIIFCPVHGICVSKNSVNRRDSRGKIPENN